MKKNKGIGLIFLTAVVSAAVVFVSKYGVSVVNPYIFTALKNVIVAFFFVGWLIMAKDWRILRQIKRKQWLLLLAVGFVGGSVPFLLYFKGLSLTSEVQAAFIHKSMFIFIFVLAAVFLKEKISRKLLIAGLSLFLANILLLKLTPFNFGRGDFLILLATGLWAIENVLSKYLLRELPARIVVWARMFLGSVFIFFYLFLTNQASLVFFLNVRQVGWVMITAVFLLGYVASWYAGLKYINVSTAAAILLLAGPMTSLISLFSGRFLSLNFSQTTGLILTGLTVFLAFLTYYAKQRKFVRI